MFIGSQYRQQVFNRCDQIRIGGRAHRMAVHMFELGEVKTGGGPTNGAEIEEIDHFFHREKFLIAMAPAQPHQIIAQGLGQIAHGLIGFYTQSTVAFGQFCTIGPMNQRNMCHFRYVPATGLIDLGLAGCIGQMIIATDDVGNTHVMVIDDNRQHISRPAVRA